MDDPHSTRASLQVAPLAIQKGRSGSTSDSSLAHEEASQTSSLEPYSDAHLTPPSTPTEYDEGFDGQTGVRHPVFHNFLRAFYPFQPDYVVGESTVTLPLAEGDVVLVHSIHTNGWADGTLLLTGARGWLPTNYCEAYDPEEMRNLLQALLNFWDLLRSTATNDCDIFGNQEFMKGIIAGVRYLLERTNCLTRETTTIHRSEGLRRGRKSLLSELSALVKTAKRLQELLRVSAYPRGGINDVIDEMILGAFKIVLKGVRFLDFLEEDRRQRAPPAVTIMATVAEESYVPPTPPAETSGLEEEQGQGTLQGDAGDRRTEEGVAAGLVPSRTGESARVNAAASRRLSAVYSSASNRLSQANPGLANRLSTCISHRVSMVGPSPLSQPQNLVSERLNASHDTFLSYLGSFIGRLHLQSQSRQELALAIKQSATSGGELFAVIDSVCRQNPAGLQPLDQARAAMFDRIQDFVYSARDILSTADPDADDVIVAQDNGRLLLAATSCVKAAGECVAKTKWVLERIGDYEFEDGQGGLGIDLSVLESTQQTAASPPTMRNHRPQTPPNTHAIEPSNISPAKTATSSPARPIQVSMEKPLPQIPQAADKQDAAPCSPPPSRPPSIVVDDNASSMASSVSSIRQLLPPLPKLTTTLVAEESYSPTTDQSHDSEYQSSFRSDTTASSAGTSTTFASRDSEVGMASQASTGATTPDQALVPCLQPSLSELSASGSNSAAEEVDEVESRLMEKTFVHELIYNKEGQVTGGSLPALVERLTTHESTPDAVFVSAFYLTFRLFCTPSELAEALIDRFEYVGETPQVASPVRLRVYNVMKGWLESHWRDITDRDALPTIRHFAEFTLGSLLPSAGRRLAELAGRVSSTDGSLVPRLVSSMGKTSTSIAQYIAADTPVPNPTISRSQQNLLNNWKAGGTCPSVLDFDPLEIARQLTLKQMNIFCTILPEELLGSQWMKRGGVDSPNVKAMSALTTDVSNLVAETILQYPDVKKRAAAIKQWIKIAHECFKLHNYDGLMSIICSLNSSIISRLRKTWDVISTKRREMLQSLQAIVEPSNNNKVLRARLQEHVPPCLPFLGMFLTDLTFVDIGNPATKQLPGVGCEEQGLTVVNFDKHSRTAKIIGELQRFQIPYRLTEVTDLQDWLQAEIIRVKESTDQGSMQVSYYRKSLLLEPRENPMRTQVEALPSNSHSGQKADLFSWMTRDRGHNNNSSTSAVPI